MHVILQRLASNHAAAFLFVAATLAIAGCSTGSTFSSPSAGPLVTVTMHGGACAAVPCDATVYLDVDGRVHAAAKPPNDLGQVPVAKMAVLTAALQATDFAAMKAHPFTGQCPVAVDGQELIFEFAVGGGTQRIASCEVAIDWGQPLFAALAAALAQWVPIPAA